MTSAIKTRALAIAIQTLQQAPNGLTLDQIVNDVLLQIEHFHSRREAQAVIRDGLRSHPRVLVQSDLYEVNQYD
jgi:hypothetical protein